MASTVYETEICLGVSLRQNNLTPERSEESVFTCKGIKKWCSLHTPDMTGN